MAAPKHPAHPTKRTPEIVDAILAEITTSSTANLRDACKRQGIAAPTFMDWVDKDEELAERYARAKEAQTELMVNEMVSISDDPSLDANSKRVMIDTRKWIASKLKPKKYGDRLDLNAQIEVAPLVALNSRKRLVSDGKE